MAINLVRIYGNDQTSVLLDGRADIAFVNLPVDDHRLNLTPVRAEPRVAAVSTTSAAGRSEASIADLAEDAVIIDRGTTPSLLPPDK